MQQTPCEAYTYESKEFVVMNLDRHADGVVQFSPFASRGSSKECDRIKYLTMEIKYMDKILLIRLVNILICHLNDL